MKIRRWVGIGLLIAIFLIIAFFAYSLWIYSNAGDDWGPTSTAVVATNYAVMTEYAQMCAQGLGTIVDCDSWTATPSETATKR